MRYAVDSVEISRLHDRKDKIYPFNHMNVDESFFVPADTPKLRKRATTAASVYKVNHPGWSYACRKIEKGEEPHGQEGVRIWCTALARWAFNWRIDGDYPPDPDSDFEGGWDTWNAGTVSAKDPTTCEQCVEQFKEMCLAKPSRFRFLIDDVLIAETDGKGNLTMHRPVPSRLKQPGPLPPHLRR